MDEDILPVANENNMFKVWLVLEESETDRFLKKCLKYIVAFPLA